MAAKDDIRAFLTTRRAKITPDQAGLPVYGVNRRVTGLRREEVALLAGISVEYYTRLERGSVGSVSDSVLDGLVHALQLDEAERDHLFRLVRTAANDLGRALYSPLYEQADAGEHPNSARFLFLDPAASEFFVDYDKVLNDCVAFLRAEAGRDPYDKDLSELVGELSTRSDDFRRRWAAHDVRYHRTGRKRFHHPVVGDLELDFEAFELPGDPGQRFNVYTAPPDSSSEQALDLLASWTAPTSTHPESEDTWSS